MEESKENKLIESNLNSLNMDHESIKVDQKGHHELSSDQFKVKIKYADLHNQTHLSSKVSQPCQTSEDEMRESFGRTQDHFHAIRNSYLIKKKRNEFIN